MYLTINTDNAAFGDTAAEEARELARILRKLADRVEQTGRQCGSRLLRDVNGNAVGVCEYDVDVRDEILALYDGLPLTEGDTSDEARDAICGSMAQFVEALGFDPLDF